MTFIWGEVTQIFVPPSSSEIIFSHLFSATLNEIKDSYSLIVLPQKPSLQVQLDTRPCISKLCHVIHTNNDIGN